MNRTPSHKLGHGGRGPRDREPAYERDEPGHGSRSRAAGVADLARNDQADDAGDEECGERPPDRPDAVQLPSGRRQRRGHRHRLERNEGDEDQDSSARQAVGRCENGGRSRSRLLPDLRLHHHLRMQRQAWLRSIRPEV